MDQPTQYILHNYLDGTIKIGQWDPDWPEWTIVKQYEGESQQELDEYERRHNLELLSDMSELNRQPAVNILDLLRANGKLIDITPKK